MLEEMLTSAEAAVRLSVHVKTVNRWCRQGKLPGAALRYGSRRLGWRIPRSVVDELVHYEHHRGGRGLAAPVELTERMGA